MEVLHSTITVISSAPADALWIGLFRHMPLTTWGAEAGVMLSQGRAEPQGRAKVMLSSETSALQQVMGRAKVMPRSNLAV
eukprot:1141309-Pelagomonas_calceolata.AAC.3